MGFPVALAVLILAASSNGNQSLESEYSEARTLFRAERYDLALPTAEDGLARAERNGTEKDRWRFRLLKADVLIEQRLAAKALAFINQYPEPPGGAEWAEERAHRLLLQGRASAEQGMLKEGEQLLARAAPAAREAKSATLMAEVKLRQGRVLIQQSKFEAARRIFRDVAATANQIHDLHLEATALGNIGYALLTESRNDEAIAWFDQAINVFTQSGAGESVARTHGNLGNCYLRLGNYDSARLHFEKAQQWFIKTGNRESQQIWIGNAGNVDYETGDFPGAAKAYQQALDIARQVPSPVWVARWLNNLAETSLQLGNWDAAETYSKEALLAMQRLKDVNWEPTSLVVAARIEEGRGHPDRARELFRSALSLPAEDPAVPLDSHAGLARSWLREGRMKEADAEFRNTVGVIEQRRAGLLKDDYKLAYLSSLIRFYQDYVDFLVASHQPEKALEVAESSRSRVLESRVVEAGTGRGESPPAGTASDYRRLAQQMNAVVFEYWLGARHSYLWVITAQEIQLHELPARASIHSLITSYQAIIARGRDPLQAGGDTGRRLYEALIQPAGETGKSGRFLIVPDEDLYSFDLESLPSPAAPGKFWIEQATVSVTPSLNFLTRRSHPADSPKPRSLFVMGDAPGLSAQYPRLEYASQEIDSIARTFEGGRKAIVRGTSATPEAYASSNPGQFGFIHFAAHAAADPQSPLDSAVILAGPPDANRLLARSVMAVPLTAELVTISACRSAGGRAYGGEGLVGFAWAFLRAGARHVIAGLWDVSDRSTAELMAGLYANIAAGEDVPEALRAAKLGLIHRGGVYAKPYYWAPFQLYVGAVR